MPFDLKITFTGLCLFAVDDACPVGPRLHVLLMKSKEATHYPALLYDKAYGDPHATHEEMFFLCAKLDNALLDFPSDATTPPQSSSVPISSSGTSGMPDINEFTNLGKIERMYVEGDSAGVASSRFTLRTGKASKPSPGAAFNVPTITGATLDRYLVHYTEWVIPGLTSTVNGRDGLLLQFQKLDQSIPHPPLALPLYAHKNMIRIVALNAVPQDIPPNMPAPVKPGQEASHFRDYYQIFSGIQSNQKMTPTLVRSNDNDIPAFPGWLGGCDWARSLVRPQAALATLISPVCIHALARVKSPGGT